MQRVFPTPNDSLMLFAAAYVRSYSAPFTRRRLTLQFGTYFQETFKDIPF